MNRLIIHGCVLALVVFSALLMPASALADPGVTGNCLYPSPADRFGITVYSNQQITSYNVSSLGASRYLNWRADVEPAHPSAMDYYFMVRVREGWYSPTAQTLKFVALNNPGAIWIVGNEADVLWQDNTSPATYARSFNAIYTAITSVDPTARFVISGVVQVSPLRLAWLEQVWDTYRTLYGTDIPIDIWNIHTYVANEMHQEWGFEIPAGIPNAVGYSDRLGTHWSKVNDAAASGGTYHQSKTVDAKAYFAFHGNNVTVYLRSGPDAGIAAIYLDQAGSPVAQVDLYTPTPGTISRTFSNLSAAGGLLADRHNVRIQVTGARNPASSNTWVRVDAMTATSTATLPNARFEDDSPLRAMIVTTVDDHDNLDLIEQQIRDFRQWLLNHGQRNKPLINTEYGILMTEDIGFDYGRVRNFMLNSFNRFLNLSDAATGYPADDNRLLQEWFWFSLAVNDFEGRVVHTGLYDDETYAIKPLGIDYGNYVRPLKQSYVDLEVLGTTVTPYWPIFASDPSLLHIETTVRNRGNLASGPFAVNIRAGNGSLLHSQPIAGLAKRFDPGYYTSVAYDWVIAMPSTRGVSVIADEANAVAEPCDPNNTAYIQVDTLPSTDLAVVNLRTDPAVLPSVPPGATIPLTFKADLRNLGSVGTAAAQVRVSFWHGNPDAGGVLLAQQVLTPGSVTLPFTFSMIWPERSVGTYQIYARVDPVSEESSTANNTAHITVQVNGSTVHFPLMKYRLREASTSPANEAASNPLWVTAKSPLLLPAAGK